MQETVCVQGVPEEILGNEDSCLLGMGNRCSPPTRLSCSPAALELFRLHHRRHQTEWLIHTLIVLFLFPVTRGYFPSGGKFDLIFSKI